MSKHSYTEIEFKNAPDHKTTPLNASNLNHIEEGITNAFTDISDTQEVIAPVEDTLTASQAYAIGDQFIYQNVLYKATAAISAGGTITIGGNCSLADSITKQLREFISYDIELENTTINANSLLQIPFSDAGVSGYNLVGYSIYVTDAIVATVAKYPSNLLFANLYNPNTISITIKPHVVATYRKA